MSFSSNSIFSSVAESADLHLSKYRRKSPLFSIGRYSKTDMVALNAPWRQSNKEETYTPLP